MCAPERGGRVEELLQISINFVFFRFLTVSTPLSLSLSQSLYVMEVEGRE